MWVEVKDDTDKAARDVGDAGSILSQKHLTGPVSSGLMVDVLRKEMSCSFDEAVRRVEQACGQEKFAVLLTKNLDEVFREKLGLKEYPRYSIVLACAPTLAKMALDVSKDVGTLFPCSFVVYEDNGRVIVAHTSIMKIAVETNLAPAAKMKPVLDETGKRVRAVWERI